MIQMVNLFKRNPDLSMEEFIDHYETEHRKVGEKYLSITSKTKRRSA